jgi:hypothetical protein
LQADVLGRAADQGLCIVAGTRGLDVGDDDVERGVDLLDALDDRVPLGIGRAPRLLGVVAC